MYVSNDPDSVAPVVYVVVRHDWDVMENRISQKIMACTSTARAARRWIEDARARCSKYLVHKQPYPQWSVVVVPKVDEEER